jgi:hypothetical protein
LAEAIQVQVVDSDDLDKHVGDFLVKGATNFKALVRREFRGDGNVLSYPVPTLLLEPKVAKGLLISERRSRNEV